MNRIKETWNRMPLWAKVTDVCLLIVYLGLICWYIEMLLHR